MAGLYYFAAPSDRCPLCLCLKWGLHFRSACIIVDDCRGLGASHLEIACRFRGFCRHQAEPQVQLHKQVALAACIFWSRCLLILLIREEGSKLSLYLPCWPEPASSCGSRSSGLRCAACLSWRSWPQVPGQQGLSSLAPPSSLAFR